MTEAVAEYVPTPKHRQNGRTPPPLPTVTLPDSGYTVEIRPIGPLTMQDLNRDVRKEMPAPEPPLNTVKGLDGKDTREANPLDPDYQDALRTHEAAVTEVIGQRMFALIARRGVATPVDAEAVARARADFAGIVSLPDDDREVFLRHVLIASTEDLTALQAAILRRSQPTEEAISEKVADFPDPVQGA